VGSPEPAAFAPDARGGLIEIVAAARRAVAVMTDLPIDQIVSCEADGETWRVVLDVVEAPARIGDNDLLATYELALGSSGELHRIARLGRYHREDPPS
jgi:hypothetical protein